MSRFAISDYRMTVVYAVYGYNTVVDLDTWASGMNPAQDSGTMVVVFTSRSLSAGLQDSNG